MNKETRRLITMAKARMSQSFDQIHDKSHAKRVALYARDLSNALGLSQFEKHSLILAAWWHDTGRTITKKPSIIWMRVVDDAISAFFLWKASKKVKDKSGISNLAARLILCKGIGSGKIFTRLFLKKEHYILLHILKDADTLDVLSVERVNHLCFLAQKSKLNKLKYKFTIWWFLHSKEFQFRTQHSKKFFESVLQDFLLWTTETHVFEWHEKNFGVEWIENKVDGVQKLLKDIQKSIRFS